MVPYLQMQCPMEIMSLYLVTKATLCQGNELLCALLEICQQILELVKQVSTGKTLVLCSMLLLPMTNVIDVYNLTLPQSK